MNKAPLSFKVAAQKKYNDKMPVDAYILAKSGIADAHIAEALGISHPTFITWRNIHPAFKYALDQAKAVHSISGATNFKEYVYKQLSPELRGLWEEIELWHDHSNGREKIEAIMSRQPRRMRQSVWIHAMIECNFNQSEACRRCAISRSTIQNWAKEDPEFPKLLDEIDWHQKNFLENGLMSLVAAGNTLATVFANRTRNRDRGYGDKLSVEVSGSINVNHNHIASIDALDLPIEMRVLLRDKLRAIKPTQEVTDIKALVVTKETSDDEDPQG